MRKLIVITQRVDPDDPALGATIPMLRALAERVDELVVLTLAARDAGLPGNVRVKVIAAPNQLLRGARFAAALAPELRARPVAVLAHMSPIYAVLAAPLVRPLRIPLLLWFTHWRPSRLLKAAERVSTRVLTVDRRSFPFDTPKVTPIGHGIDVASLPCVEPAPGPLRYDEFHAERLASSPPALSAAFSPHWSRYTILGTTLNPCPPPRTPAPST